MLPLLTWTWPETPLAIAIILLLALVAHWALRRAIRIGVNTSLRNTAERERARPGRVGRALASAGLSTQRHEARARAIGSVLRSATSIVVLVVTLLSVLDAVDVPIAPILASAGIGGVALAFGAQSLVKDYLSGMFMLFEDQYGVGDLIKVGDVSGTVEDITLRVTRVRDATGQVWYLRNGEITTLGNLSQGFSMGTIDVPVAFNEDPARVVEVLNREMDAVFADDKWSEVLLERPDVVGVQNVSGGAMTIRIFAKCAPNQHWGVQRDILERSVNALRAAGIRGPLLTPGSTVAPAS